MHLERAFIDVTLGILALFDRYDILVACDPDRPSHAEAWPVEILANQVTALIRENRPRMKGTLAEIIDRSINQTLARTLLTSLTTLLAVLILFGFNVGSRNDLEGFAYAVIIGVIVGTYSSMFVASPSLLMLETRREAKAAEEAAKEKEPDDRAKARYLPRPSTRQRGCLCLVTCSFPTKVTTTRLMTDSLRLKTRLRKPQNEGYDI